MTNSPTIETRAAQAYVAKRAVVPMSKFAETIPALTREVADWLAAHGVKPSGGSLVRFNVLNMPERMDIEIGYPVDKAPEVDGEFSSGVLPAGQYGTLSYTGVADGMPANKQLIDWIDDQGEDMDCRATREGDVFAGRFELLLSDPQSERDQSKWRTQVGIKIRDHADK